MCSLCCQAMLLATKIWSSKSNQADVSLFVAFLQGALRQSRMEQARNVGFDEFCVHKSQPGQ